MTAHRLHALMRELQHGCATLYGKRLRGLYFGGKQSESEVEVVVVLDQMISNEAERERTRTLASTLAARHGLRIFPVFVPARAWRQSQ